MPKYYYYTYKGRHYRFPVMSLLGMTVTVGGILAGLMIFTGLPLAAYILAM